MWRIDFDSTNKSGKCNIHFLRLFLLSRYFSSLCKVLPVRTVGTSECISIKHRICFNSVALQATSGEALISTADNSICSSCHIKQTSILFSLNKKHFPVQGKFVLDKAQRNSYCLSNILLFSHFINRFVGLSAGYFFKIQELFKIL
jgi:hypothetical protein